MVCNLCVLRDGDNCDDYDGNNNDDSNGNDANRLRSSARR